MQKIFQRTDGSTEAVVLLNVGGRGEMQDVADLQKDFPEPGDVWVGVYDGHGDLGLTAALFAQKNIPQLWRAARARGASIEDSFKQSYAEVAQTYHDPQSGTCVAHTLISKGMIYIANAGDCETLLVGDSVYRTVTARHRAYDERARLEKLGVKIGYYGIPNQSGEYDLEISRSIGDKDFWCSGLLSEPHLSLVEDIKPFKFLISGSDGLFGELTQEEIVDIVRDRTDPNIIAEVLKDTVLLRSMRHGRVRADNISIVVIALFPA